jgi:hypothetical protein
MPRTKAMYDDQVNRKKKLAKEHQAAVKKEKERNQKGRERLLEAEKKRLEYLKTHGKMTPDERMLVNQQRLRVLAEEKRLKEEEEEKESWLNNEKYQKGVLRKLDIIIARLSGSTNPFDLYGGKRRRKTRRKKRKKKKRKTKKRRKKTKRRKNRKLK